MRYTRRLVTFVPSVVIVTTPSALVAIDRATGDVVTVNGASETADESVKTIHVSRRACVYFGTKSIVFGTNGGSTGIASAAVAYVAHECEPSPASSHVSALEASTAVHVGSNVAAGSAVVRLLGLSTRRRSDANRAVV